MANSFRQNGGNKLRRFALGVAIIILAGSFLSVPASAQEASPGAASENAAEKTRDLQRARANRGTSPDRVVVVYDAATAASETQPNRLRARQQAGARLLRAETRSAGTSCASTRATQAPLRSDCGGRPACPTPMPIPIATVALLQRPRAAEQWGLPRIQAPAVWDTTQGQNIKVAVLDCGIHGSHPDYRSRRARVQLHRRPDPG